MRLLLILLAAFASTAHAGCKPKEMQLKTMQKFLVVSECQPYPPHVLVHNNKTYACYEYLMSVVKIDDLLGTGCGAASPGLATSINMFAKPNGDGHVCYSFCKQVGIKTTEASTTKSTTLSATTTQTTTGTITATSTVTSTVASLMVSKETVMPTSTTVVISRNSIETTSVYTSKQMQKLVSPTRATHGSQSTKKGRSSAASLQSTVSSRAHELKKTGSGISAGAFVGVVASILITVCLAAWLYRVKRTGIQEEDMVVQDDANNMYEVPVPIENDQMYDNINGDSFANPLYDQNEQNFGYAQVMNTYDAAC